MLECSYERGRCGDAAMIAVGASALRLDATPEGGTSGTVAGVATLGDLRQDLGVELNQSHRGFLQTSHTPLSKLAEDSTSPILQSLSNAAVYKSTIASDEVCASRISSR